jgi:EmrB/QacA subfamily drug resistance transporter
MRPIAEMDTRTKVLVMAGTLLGLFTAAMDQTVVATSIPHIVADLGGFGLFSWVGTGFLLASTTTIPIVGKLSDLYGRKPFYMLGIFLLLMGSALSGSSQNIEQLIAFRIIQGFGAGMIMSIAFTLVADVFPPAERGRWMGLMTGVFAAASVLGPLIGGTLTDHVDWRWVFYVNLPLGGVSLLFVFFGMPSIRPEKKPNIDYRGLVLLSATTVPMLLAFSWAGDRYAWISPEVIGFLAWAAIALCLFTYFELRTEEPLLPMQLFKIRAFTVSSLVTIITGFAMMGSLFYIPLFVQGVLGASATNSGLVTMPMMIAMAIASAISGQVMSRLGKYRIMGVVGLMIMVAGMAYLSTMTANSTRTDVTYAMIVFGVGLGTSMPLFMLAVQNAVPYRVMGISTSTMQFLRSVGGTMGVAIMFSVIQAQYHQGIEENVPVAGAVRRSAGRPAVPGQHAGAGAGRGRLRVLRPGRRGALRRDAGWRAGVAGGWGLGRLLHRYLCALRGGRCRLLRQRGADTQDAHAGGDRGPAATPARRWRACAQTAGRRR